jgi:hypothetical protein
MEIFGAMVVLGVVQVSLFSSKGWFGKTSSSEDWSGLFCKVLTWFVDVDRLVVCGVSGTVKDELSMCCKCVLMALRKSVWFSWICVWLVCVI